MTGTTQTTPPSASVRTRRAFAVLASIEFLTVMDASVVNIALPDIRSDLGFTAADTSWVVNTYLIAFAGLLLTAGSLADAIGRRTMFLAGTLTFTAASLMCAVSTAPWHLLTGRAVQGVGAALVMPSAIALIGTIFPTGRERIRAMGIFSGMAGIAAPIGLVAGGLLTAVDWHLIFWINVPIGLAVAAAAIAWLPTPARVGSHVDPIAATSGTACLALLCFTAISLEHPGPASVPTLTATAAAVAAAATFIARQNTAAHPLLPAPLLNAPGLLRANAIFVVVGTSLLTTFYVITLYLQETRGMGPIPAMLTYLPVPLAMLAGTQLAPRLIGHRGVRLTLGLGLATQAVGLLAWTLLSGTNTNLATTHLVPILVWATGLGMAIVASFVASTGTAPETSAGTASGLATTSYQGGGAIGLAVLAALAAATTPGEAAAPSATTQLTGYHVAIGVLAALTTAAAVATRTLPRS